jgi:uncharacterized SAM-binding protein YcdF (DUF218 family)
MFFSLSKLFWLLAAPSHVLAWVVLAAAMCVLAGWSCAARGLSLAAAGLFLLIGVLPLQTRMIQPLEDRYPRPTWPFRVDGVLILGGGLNAAILQARRAPAQEGSEARLVSAYEVARHYPGARVIFSGGSARLGHSVYTEADAARAIFRQMGLDPARLFLESRSRNTYENILFSRTLAQPRSGETWLLATSAIQMPRAMMVARRAGWALVPWPTDYLTAAGSSRTFSISENLALSDAAMHEWIGLLAYQLGGKS